MKTLTLFVTDHLSQYSSTAPYSYHHIQDFTRDISTFKKSVKNKNTQGNADFPEGGLDALLQAIVCEGKICFIGRTLVIVYSVTVNL